jgi:2-C-methyl-D-erythritol 4-phosphate cytidylyltransferase
MAHRAKFWAVIPAAGSGSRMQTEIPKQYLKINGKCILEYTLECFCSHPRIAGVVLVLAAGDEHWRALPGARHAKVRTAAGGVERFHSVLNGLRRLREQADDDDWVLVHDAVRPCLRHADIDLLIKESRGHPVGGLLAVPVRDTLKRANQAGEVAETVSRAGLWHALTPQMFRLRMLEEAIARCIDDGNSITDEAQAMEFRGHRPRLVPGRADNIKITRREDLPLAEMILSRAEGRA